MSQSDFCEIKTMFVSFERLKQVMGEPPLLKYFYIKPAYMPMPLVEIM